MRVRNTIAGLVLLGASAVSISHLHDWLRAPPPRPAALGLDAPDREGEDAALPPLSSPSATDGDLPVVMAGDADFPDETGGRNQEPAGAKTRPRPTPFREDCANILLIGLDPRAKKRSLGRPDTIVLAALPGDGDELGLVSIPRDLYLEIPGHGFDRINAVFGAAQRNRGDPLKLLKSVVGRAFKLRVKYAVVVDLGTFERGVDLLGGLSVEVPCPIKDNFVDPRTPTGRRLLDLTAGRQIMDGATAGMYVRSRHGRSDWSRAQRQQAVLMAMRDRLLTVAGLFRLPGLWSALESGIVTDIPRAEILGLALRLAEVRTDRVHGIVLGLRQTRSWRSPEGRSVLLPDDRAIRGALSGLFDAPAPGLQPPGSPCPPAEAALAKRWGD